MLYPKDFNNIFADYGNLKAASKPFINDRPILKDKPRNINDFVNNIKNLYYKCQQLFVHVSNELYKGLDMRTFNTIKSSWDNFVNIIQNNLTISEDKLNKVFSTSPKVKKYYDLIMSENGYLQFFNKFFNYQIDDIGFLDRKTFRIMQKHLPGTYPQKFIALQEDYQNNNEGNRTFENYIKSKLNKKR